MAGFFVYEKVNSDGINVLHIIPNKTNQLPEDGVGVEIYMEDVVTDIKVDGESIIPEG